MEFWGVEVKAGEPLTCDPGFRTYVHLSQASLGEVKKDHRNDLVPVFVEVNGQKLVLGTLSPDKCSQILFDLIFEKEFVLSHNWKNGSVYFCGYKSVQEDPEDFTDTDSDSEEEDHPLVVKDGKREVKDEKPKPVADRVNAAKIEPKLNAKQAELKMAKDEDDDDDDESEEEDSDDEDMVEAGDDSDDDDDEDDESSEEEDATVKKAETDKKRPAESAVKTPVPEKKAKLVSPSGQKKGDDGKKGGHTATPHPSKKGGKTPASNDKSKPQTPKSVGQVTCKSCSRTFNSGNALESHTKAKHSAGK